MNALFFKNGRLAHVKDTPVPEPAKGEALVRITYAGICNTDVEITKGYMDFQGIPGHEFAGIVERVSEKGYEGKRVTGEINIGCTKCSFCRAGTPAHCRDRSVLGIHGKNGAFAEYITLPVRNLHILPDSISDEEAVFIEPLAAAMEITRQIDILPYQRVCVLGDGKLGLLAAQVILSAGCSPLVVGKYERKLSILKGLGIRTELLRNFRGRDFDIVVECTGSPRGVETGMAVLRPGGTLIVKTTTAGKRNADLNALVVHELVMRGSRCGPFLPAIDLIARKKAVLSPLVDRVFPLDKGVEAFRYAKRKGVLKVLLQVTG